MWSEANKPPSAPENSANLPELSDNVLGMHVLDNLIGEHHVDAVRRDRDCASIIENDMQIGRSLQIPHDLVRHLQSVDLRHSSRHFCGDHAISRAYLQERRFRAQIWPQERQLTPVSR